MTEKQRRKKLVNHTCTEYELIAPRCGPIKSNYSSLFLINTTDTAIKSTPGISYIGDISRKQKISLA